MNILTADCVAVDKLRKFRKLFSDISERDLEDERGIEAGQPKEDIDMESASQEQASVTRSKVSYINSGNMSPRADAAMKNSYLARLGQSGGEQL